MPSSTSKNIKFPQTGRFRLPTRFLFNQLEAAINRRFEAVLAASAPIPLNDDTSLILFSDLHRSDKGILDRFAQNESLFNQALDYYNHKEFTYIELGDGDELWEVDNFATIQTAYGAVFDRLKNFHKDGRLQMVVGNHDIGRDKKLAKNKLGVPLKLGLRFLHQRSGRELFFTHGHQSDIESGDFSRIMLRYMANPLQKLAHSSIHTNNRFLRWVRDVTEQIENNYAVHAFELERRIKNWTAHHPQKIVVCGHTHVPRFAQGNYFNTGSCLEPGLLTGIEISKGQIMQIRWHKTSNGTSHRQILNSSPIAKLFPK